MFEYSGAGALKDKLVAPQPGETILLTGGLLLDMTGGERRPGSVLVRGGVVEAVGMDITAPPEARQVDVEGSTLVPGLIDCHVRLTGAPPPAAGAIPASHA